MCSNELTNRPRLQKLFPEDGLRHLLIQSTNIDGRICTYNATIVCIKANMCVRSYVYSKQDIFGLTQEWFRVVLL